MHLLRRLRNLWVLSEFEVPPIGKKINEYPLGSMVTTSLVKPKRAATIIEPNNYTDDIPTVEQPR